MVEFGTYIELIRVNTDSLLVLSFRSLCSIEFIMSDIMSKYPEWQVCSVGHYAQYDNKRFHWHGPGAPKDFTGDWHFMYEATESIADWIINDT